jgi:hypothetical protein
VKKHSRGPRQPKPEEPSQTAPPLDQFGLPKRGSILGEGDEDYRARMAALERKEEEAVNASIWHRHGWDEAKARFDELFEKKRERRKRPPKRERNADLLARCDEKVRTGADPVKVPRLVADEWHSNHPGDSVDSIMRQIQRLASQRSAEYERQCAAWERWLAWCKLHGVPPTPPPTLLGSHGSDENDDK